MYERESTADQARTLYWGHVVKVVGTIKSAMMYVDWQLRHAVPLVGTSGSLVMRCGLHLGHAIALSMTRHRVYVDTLPCRDPWSYLNYRGCCIRHVWSRLLRAVTLYACVIAMVRRVAVRPHEGCAYSKMPSFASFMGVHMCLHCYG